jgi:hypothetical protein
MAGLGRGKMLLGLLPGLLLGPGGAAAQRGASSGTARVTYLNSGWVFIDAGSADGLRRGGRVDIVRRGRTVVVLQVESLGAHQASCVVVSRQVAPRVGDSVRFSPVARPDPKPPVATRSPSPAVRPSPPPSFRDSAATRAAERAPAGTRRLDSAPAVPPPAPKGSVFTPSPRPAPGFSAPRSDTATKAGPPLAPEPAATGQAAGTARVTFLTTNSVYVSAGRADGLVVGSRVDVLHGARPVAQLTVAFLSTHQASCQVVSKVDSVSVGDTVRFVPVAAVGDSIVAVIAPAARQTVRRPARSSTGRLRGRVGVYYLAVQQRDSFGGQFSQPSGDIRLTGVGLGGSPFGLTVDVRTRRLVQALPGSPTSTRSQTRVYQASAIWQAAGSPLRFTTGRQYAPGISSVGLLDGASAEAAYARWDYGVFAGTQPELVNLDFSSDVAQLGGYLRRHNAPGSPQHWSMTVGASGSYFHGHTNREFLYLQANYLTRRVSLYAVQEVDYYRPWRRVNGEQAVSPTSTFANLQFQVTGALSLTAGVDNRRSVRLYRDVVNPLTEFDDAFRRGVWAGLTTRVANHFRAGFDARTNHGGSNGAANTYTLALGAERLTPLGVSVRSRSTRYTTAGRDGWLHAASVGLEPFGRGSIQLTSGWRSEHDTTAAPTLNVRWMSLDLDVSLARAVFVILSGYQERGGIEAHDLLYAGFSYRF